MRRSRLGTLVLSVWATCQVEASAGNEGLRRASHLFILLLTISPPYHGMLDLDKGEASEVVPPHRGIPLGH